MIREGDAVVAVCDIGGRSGYVPAGTEGVLIDAGGVFRAPRVAFTVSAGWLSGDQTVVLDVDARDIGARL